MHKDHRQKRHRPPKRPSRLLLLAKVIIAIGQAASFIGHIFHLHE